MPFDYKKKYKEFYLPPQKPQLLEVPPMNYVAVRGHGDPNAQDGEYQAAIGMLYAVAFTIKMSYKGTHQIPGYFEYVVPPLEGLWWQEGQSRVDYAHKETFSWIAMIRLPEFVTKQEFDWAVAEAAAKKSWISAKWSTLLMMKACACSACTLATMIPSPQRSTQWSSLRRSGTIKLTAPPLACTTKFTSAIPAALLRKNARPLSGNPSARWSKDRRKENKIKIKTAVPPDQYRGRAVFCSYHEKTGTPACLILAKVLCFRSKKKGRSQNALVFKVFLI